MRMLLLFGFFYPLVSVLVYGMSKCGIRFPWNRKVRTNFKQILSTFVVLRQRNPNLNYSYLTSLPGHCVLIA